MHAVTNAEMSVAAQAFGTFVGVGAAVSGV